MRQYKFRLRDSQTNEILYKISDHWTFWDGNTLTGIQEYLILEQFTGLADINGVEIYEGDHVRVTVTPASPDEELFESNIEYKDGCFFVTDPRDNAPLFLYFFSEKHSNGYRPLRIEVLK